MLKKLLAGLLAMAFISAPALAEVYAGTTVATRTVPVTAEAAGVLQSLNAEIGMQVSRGDVLAEYRTEKVFASQDGTIARIQASEDEEISGTVLELRPVSRYTIHCTVDGAYDSVANGLVHSGEQLYVYCTANGTHRGTATVTQIDADVYLAEATGGTLYVGETVYLYRSDEFKSVYRVGKGTVVASDVEVYESEGKIAKLHVSQGEFVQRGELLYEIISGGEIQIEAPESGILTARAVSAGEEVQSGQALFAIAPLEDICVEIQADESAAARIRIGDSAALSYAADAEERLVPGEVISVSRIPEDGSYAVRIRPEEAPAYLGMTVAVRIAG